MADRFPSAFIVSQTFLPIAISAETVLATTPAPNLPFTYAGVFLLWYIKLVVGASTTALTTIIRRGVGLGGTVMNIQFQDQGGIASAQEITRAGIWVDTQAAGTFQQYTLTTQQANGTATGQLHELAFMAFAL